MFFPATHHHSFLHIVLNGWRSFNAKCLEFYSACELVTPTNRLDWLDRTPLLPTEPVGGSAGAFTAVVCSSVNEETSRWDQTEQAAVAATVVVAIAAAVAAAAMVEVAVVEVAVAETVAIVAVAAAVHKLHLE